MGFILSRDQGHRYPQSITHTWRGQKKFTFSEWCLLFTSLYRSFFKCLQRASVTETVSAFHMEDFRQNGISWQILCVDFPLFYAYSRHTFAWTYVVYFVQCHLPRCHHFQTCNWFHFGGICHNTTDSVLFYSPSHMLLRWHFLSSIGNS